MTIGVGGSSKEAALARLTNMMAGAEPIALAEYQARIERACARMRELGLSAMYLHAGSSLLYFTGMRWYPSERMVGALLCADGRLHYIAPAFEDGTVRDFMVVQGPIRTWHEHENPYRLFVQLLDEQLGGETLPLIGLSECTPFFVADGIQQQGGRYRYVNAKSVTAFCRMRKSAAELALMQRAKKLTLEVHKAVASILHEGITTTEVEAFIEDAHRKVGASGSYFVIVLFGEATQYPHGVKHPQTLRANDTVLIDTGCKVHNYISDITRTYVYGTPDADQRRIWNVEKEAQAAAFAAAQLGQPCASVDAAARRVLEAHDLGPGYALPGLPHRTGHGIGLDIHEWPYLVGSDDTPLDVGMCFSNEPMICVPGKFGIRLEDHFYMSAEGPRWFTEPSHSLDDPFGLQA